jgi:hypothetical protein
MIGAATAIFVAALLATGFAWVLRIIDCNEDTGSVCSTQGRTQLVLALVGLAVSFGALVASVRGGPKPGMWLLATVVIYATWVLFIFTFDESA